MDPRAVGAGDAVVRRRSRRSATRSAAIARRAGWRRVDRITFCRRTSALDHLVAPMSAQSAERYRGSNAERVRAYSGPLPLQRLAGSGSSRNSIGCESARHPHAVWHLAPPVVTDAVRRSIRLLRPEAPRRLELSYVPSAPSDRGDTDRCASGLATPPPMRLSRVLGRARSVYWSRDGNNSQWL